MPVVGPPIGVLDKAPPELALHDHGESLRVIFGAGSIEVRVEGGEPTCQRAYEPGKIAAGPVALAVVGVPSAEIDSRDPQPQVHFDHLRHDLQRLAK